MTELPTAASIVAQLSLEPHPEGGWYRETYRHNPEDGSRGASTAIYYLLAKGQRSAWHRVTDADEVWHWYAGAPLALSIAEKKGEPIVIHRLGSDLPSGNRPQIMVPAGHWQSAESLGAWSLMGCTVSPAFEFSSFEMAPADWRP